MPPDFGDGVELALTGIFQHSEVPNFELTFVIAGCKKELGLRVPTHHVDIAVVCDERHLTFHFCCAQIPQLDGPIYRAGG